MPVVGGGRAGRALAPLVGLEDPPGLHPGHDWFVVLEGRVHLLLGARVVTVDAGEAAEFATMTPHAVVAVGGPAELIMIFDRDGHRVHREGSG